jgi:hypothetical protein
MARPIRLTGALLAAGLLTLSACASHDRGPPGGGRGQGPGGPPGGAPSGAGVAEGKVALPVALLFVSMDTNADLMITTEECAAAVPALFALADSNRDGWVSAFEYADWARVTLGDEDAAPTRIGFDVDLDGSVSSKEFQSRIGDEFARLDRNRDGVLARSELLTEISRPRMERGQGQGMGGGRPSGGGGGQRPPG